MKVIELLVAYVSNQNCRTADQISKEAHLRFWGYLIGEVPLLETVRVSHTGKKRASAKLLEAWEVVKKKCKTIATANRYRAHLSAAFTAGEKGLLGDDIADHILTNPVSLIPYEKEVNRYRRALSLDEIPKLLRACYVSKNIELYFAVKMALLTGRRRGELTAIRMTWFDPDRRVIVVPAEYTKTKARDSIIPLLDEEIYAYALTRLYDEKLFETQDFGRSFATACERAGIKGVTFHSLRHTCATLLTYEGGTGINTYLGHASLHMTQHYVHNSEHHFRQQQSLLIKAISGQGETSRTLLQ